SLPVPGHGSPEKFTQVCRKLSIHDNNAATKSKQSWGFLPPSEAISDQIHWFFEASVPCPDPKVN
ncbi:MAG: hypothetical protein ABGZ35_07420, partial [Planctomycetaceae bacterium]